MQFQPIPDISADGKTGWVRSRAYVMSNAGWGLPLYENEYEKGEDGIWRISRLSGPFTMYTSWEGWGKNALNNTWPDKFDPPPDLPPSTVYLTYPAYYIVPFHYPNPVTGKPSRPTWARSAPITAPPGTRRAGGVAAGRPPRRRHPADRRAAEGLMTDSEAESPRCWRRSRWRPAHPNAVRARAPPIRWPRRPAGEWPSDGRDYTAQRYSPLTQIDASNVGQLGLAWYDDLDTYRGVEATPIYADGVLYNIARRSTSPSPTTRAPASGCGPTIPQVPREFGRYACCEPVSRGLAMWQRQDHHRHARRAADRARQGHRPAGLDHADLRARLALFDHRRAAGVRRQGRGRPVGRRLRRARLRRGLRRRRPARSCGSSSSPRAIRPRGPTARRPTRSWR